MSRLAVKFALVTNGRPIDKEHKLESLAVRKNAAPFNK